jgi:hypothetical protein
MKIIFLDFDGVLNSLDEVIHSGCMGGLTPLHKKHIKVCEYIIKHTQAKIIVTSTWRIGRTTEQLQTLLPTLPIIGKTDKLGGKRGTEIQKWSDDNKKLNVENFVILDDDTDMEHLMEHLIKTSFDYGLTYIEAIKVIEKLNGDDKSVWENRIEKRELIYKQDE